MFVQMFILVIVPIFFLFLNHCKYLCSIPISSATAILWHAQQMPCSSLVTFPVFTTFTECGFSFPATIQRSTFFGMLASKVVDGDLTKPFQHFMFWPPGTRSLPLTRRIGHRFRSRWKTLPLRLLSVFLSLGNNCHPLLNVLNHWLFYNLPCLKLVLLSSLY